MKIDLPTPEGRDFTQWLNLFIPILRTAYPMMTEFELRLRAQSILETFVTHLNLYYERTLER